uniref:Uncharacterized protein n=1 Tax=Megaselia scalaris TaxID=36166 RepID=T1GQF6_MEGSC
MKYLSSRTIESTIGSDTTTRFGSMRNSSGLNTITLNRYRDQCVWELKSIPSNYFYTLLGLPCIKYFALYAAAKTAVYMKTKHLTRSHAMREATSPPRTPTPRSDRANEFSGSLSNDLGISDSKIHNQLSPTKIMDSGGNAPSVIVTSQNQTNENISNNGSVICEADFPKLTPPKSSKNSRNSSSANSTNTNTKEQSNPQNSQDSSSNRSENSNITQKNDVLLSLIDI